VHDGPNPDQIRLAEEALRLTDEGLILPASVLERMKYQERIRDMVRPLAHALKEALQEIERLREEKQSEFDIATGYWKRAEASGGRALDAEKRIEELEEALRLAKLYLDDNDPNWENCLDGKKLADKMDAALYSLRYPREAPAQPIDEG